jgi:hypothetical protein
MSTCQDCIAEASIECCGRLICDQCLGTHLMQISLSRHRPQPVNHSINTVLSNSIHNKLANEILELGEFKNYSLQIINSFIQSIEKEVLEISEKMSQIITERCDEVEQELRTALSHLMVNDTKHPILSMFKECQTQEEVKQVQVLNKQVQCYPLGVTELLKQSMLFYMDLLTAEEESSGEKRAESFEANDFKAFPQRTLSIQSEASAFKVRAQKFPTPFVPNVYNFLPLTNKIVFYNTVDESVNELIIDGHVFSTKAAWSVSEDGKVIMTGGFDEFAKKDTFIYSSFEKKIERMPKMLTPKFNHTQLSVGNFIYVIGGMAAAPLKACEKYNLHRKEWTSFASLVVARECPAACHYSGKIYVAGGIGVESIECSFINKPKFELLTLRLPGPGRCCVFTYDDQIYILHRGKILTMSLPGMVLKQTFELEKNDVWSSCEPIVRVNDVEWVNDESFVMFEMSKQRLKVIE